MENLHVRINVATIIIMKSMAKLSLKRGTYARIKNRHASANEICGSIDYNFIHF